MSELRQNLATKEWVIIATDRGKKPNKLESGIQPSSPPEKEYDHECPFCPGNEDRFSIFEYDRIESEKNKWTLKIVDNKYKILGAFDACPAFPGSFEKDGIYYRAPGCGSHFVVIESNRHNETIVDMDKKKLNDIFSMYVKKYEELKNNPNNLITLIFKNYGLLAGQTQPHTHSQIVGSRVVPLSMRSLLHESERHFDNIGSCVFCDMIEHELSESIRVIYENDDFVSFVPFAAGATHEVWILPKTHSAGISDLIGKKMDNLTGMLRVVLRKYKVLLGNPDFNYVFRIPPYPLSEVPFFHWYIQFLPRMKIIGGFQRGTNISVNTVSPEESARLLRECETCTGK